MSWAAPTGWALAALVTKLLLYGGMAGVAGAAVAVLLRADGAPARTATLYWGLASALLGAAAACGYFLVQVGMIVGAGMAGMFDGPMATLLLDTPVGFASRWRLAGFLLAVLALAAFAFVDARAAGAPGRRGLVLLVAVTAALVLVAVGSTRAGHAAVLGPVAQLALIVHLVLVVAWVGALPPLLGMTRRLPVRPLRQVMVRFGDRARFGVGLLVVAGGFLVLQLIATPAELIRSPYGAMLTGKLLLAGVLLAFALLNRSLWVPWLHRDADTDLLGLSVRFELWVAAAVLVATAYLSTLIGPAMH